MHELGITRNVVRIVSEPAQGQKVLRVTWEVGRLSGMLSEAIRFCFDICAQGTPLEGATLQIVDVEGRGHCSECGAEPVMTMPLGRCPALFDLGEKARVVIFSVTEGEDKPLKSPHMFSTADVLLVSKTDLFPHLRVDLRLMTDNALKVNPRLKIFPVSAYNGEGLDAWYGWLRGELAALAVAA